MKRSYRWMTVGACVVLAGGVAGLAARWCATGLPWQLKARWASELEPSEAHYGQVMCGPHGLSVALGRLGVGIAASEIAAQCRVTAYGVAMTDLERIAAGLRATRAEVKRLRWEELRAVDGVAVLFVQGDHYVAADPREKPPPAEKTNVIRVYDREVPARWRSRAELEKIWSGETLVITRRSTPADALDDACVAWKECYVDRGVLADATTASFQFSLENAGKKDLIVEEVKTSCGCIKHQVSAKRIAPGESARIEADVSLDNREGYIQQWMVVKTNDPAIPVSYLRMACGVPRKRPVSSEVIRLEDLPQGGTASQSFVVADPGFTGVEIRGAEFRLRGGCRSAADLTGSLSWERIGENTKEVSARTGFSASPGDYLVRLSFNAGNACPPGPFEGDVFVSVEADGSVTTRRVDIQGTIVTDVRSAPQMALITLGPEPESPGIAAIQLQSRGNREIRVVKTRSDHASAIEIAPESGPQARKNGYVVTARMPALALGGPPSNATAQFELEDGSVVSVPVTVYRPPRNAEASPGTKPQRPGKE